MKPEDFAGALRVACVLICTIGAAVCVFTGRPLSCLCFSAAAWLMRR